MDLDGVNTVEMAGDEESRDVEWTEVGVQSCSDVEYTGVGWIVKLESSVTDHVVEPDLGLVACR